jgi:hypothetical protein
MKRAKFFLGLVFLALLILGCGSSTTLQQAITKSAGITVVATVGNQANTAPTVAAPVDTAASTAIIGPTNTPEPTVTPTPAPKPLEFTGKGSKVVEVTKWSGPAIIHMVYTGSSNFAVQNFDADGNNIDLLANEIGNYDGWKPMDFKEDEATTRLQVEGTGTWTITVYPLDTQYMKIAQVPGTYQGKGDEVVYLQGGTPDTATFTYTGKRNFAVLSYTADGSEDLLVNEIDAYEGQIILSKGTVLLIVESSGPYSIEITAK